MSSTPIPLSYAVMIAIGDLGASTPDIVEILSRGQMYWTSSPSQIYAEPKRLLALGWIAQSKAPGRTRRRSMYRLTPAGREALQCWLREPVGFPRLQHRAGLHVFAGNLIDDREVVASLQQLRSEIASMRAVIQTNLQRVPLFPHRARYNLLLQDLGARLLDAHEQWLELVEQELAGDPPAGPRGLP